MIRSNTYYTLIASLPALPRHFAVERLPITRIRLEERLRMLEPEDARIIDGMAEFLVWDRQPVDVTDEGLIRHYREFMESTTNPLVRCLLEDRMDVRTILSGLRRRRKGLGPPPAAGPLGGHVARHWKHPHFELAPRFPWIEKVDQLLHEDRPMEIARILAEDVWNQWTRAAEQYYFTFEAVILYAARWELVYRWTSRDAELGSRKFEQLVTETLGEYADLYA
jgi:hypothetical protein